MNERLLQATLEAIREDMTRETAGHFVDLVTRYLEESVRGEGPVTTRQGAEAISARFSELPMTGRRLPEIIGLLERDVLADSLRLMHPGYMGPPVPPPLPVTIWTEALIGAMNQSTRMAAMSPTGTPLETQVVRWMSGLAGYGEGSGGTFTSGATESNFTALLAARAVCMPESWEEGVGEDPPFVICGENAHFTIFRAISQLGLGKKRAIIIPLREHRMDTDALAARLKELTQAGKRVMAVVATAGAFGTGSFDEVGRIGELCEEHGVWFHVDAAHGGSALLSELHRHRLAGLGRARSIAWDPHKMMLMPFQAGVILVKQERDLDNAFTTPDLGPEPRKRTWDQFKRSFQNSRRVDALKVWVALQRYGIQGLGVLYDHLCQLTQALHDELRARGDFEPLHEPECNILSFRYLGSHAGSPEELDALNRRLYVQFSKLDREWISAATINGSFALRVTMMNPLLTLAHVRKLLDGLAEAGRQVLAEGLPAPERAPGRALTEAS